MGEKLISGFEINSLKYSNGPYKFIHFSDKNLEIRSSYSLEDVLECNILTKTLPGNLGKYIFPSDSVLILKDGSKISKAMFNKILENYSRHSEKINHTDVIFDVPTEKSTMEVIEDDESDINGELTEEEIDEDGEEEDDEWEEGEEEEEEFDDPETLTEF